MPHTKKLTDLSFSPGYPETTAGDFKISYVPVDPITALEQRIGELEGELAEMRQTLESMRKFFP